MKICLVPTMFPKYKGDYYGSFVFDEARMLVEKGIEVHIVTQHNHGIPYEEVMEGICVHRFKWLEPEEFKALVHFKGLMDYFRLITYLISLFFNLIVTIRKYDIDIIHAHSVVPTGFIAVIVAKIMKKPVFITVHGMDVTNFEDSPFFKMLIKFSLNRCNKALAVSEDLARKMRLLSNQNNIIVLRNAVDLNRFKPLKNENLRKHYKIKGENTLVLFVGYLDTFKGIFELVDAFYEVNKENKNAMLMMVGEGPKENELKKKVSNLGLERSVIFMGNLKPKEIHHYYQAADIFVLPSHTEGLPLVIIEAMACGLPVVATNVGGIPELITEGFNGFLIPPKNKEKLIKTLTILINDKKLRKKISKKSVEKIEYDFNINKKIIKLIELYKMNS